MRFEPSMAIIIPLLLHDLDVVLFLLFVRTYHQLEGLTEHTFHFSISSCLLLY